MSEADQAEPIGSPPKCHRGSSSFSRTSAPAALTQSSARADSQAEDIQGTEESTRASLERCWPG